MPPARGLCPWRLSRGPPRPASVTPRWLATRLPRGHWAPPPFRFPSAGPAAPRSAPCLSVSLVPDDLTTNTAHLLLTELTSARSPGSERPVGGHGQLQGGLRRLRPVGRPALGQREAEAALAEERRAPFRSPALNPRRAPGANRPAAPPGAAVRHRRPRHCPAACVTSPARPSATSSSPGGGGCSVLSPAAAFCDCRPLIKPCTTSWRRSGNQPGTPEATLPGLGAAPGAGVRGRCAGQEGA